MSDALAGIPGTQSETLAIVFDNRRGDPQALAAAVDKVQNEGFKDVEGVRATPEALDAARNATEPIHVMPLVVTASRDDSVDEASQIRLNLDIGEEGAAVPLHIVGQGGLWAGMQELSKKDLEEAEFVGLPIVLIILLAVFGSLAAAALPLALGVAAVTVTGAIVFLLAQVMEMSIFVTNMASMLGIGVAVDYSLFILARYREELRAGRSADEARAAAMRTSGMAVVFSGVTVVVALAGLFLINAKVADSMAIGAIVVVAVAVLAAVTLLPALIALLGHRVSEPGKIVGRLRPRRKERTGPGFWERWTNALMKRPLPFAIGATALMLLIAAPGLSLQLGTGAIPQFPEDFETRQGFELAASGPGGPGALGPIQMIIDFGSQPVDQPALEAFPPQLQKFPGVAEVAPAVISRDGRRALIVITPRRAAESDETAALVDRLRDIDGPVGGAPGDRRPDGPEHRLLRSRPGLAVEGRPVRRRAQRDRAAARAAQHRAADQGGADERALGRGRLRRAGDGVPVRLVRRDHGLRLARLHPGADPGAAAGDRVRALDGLRGLHAVADQGALPGHRRQPHGRRAGSAGQRGDDLERRR